MNLTTSTGILIFTVVTAAGCAESERLLPTGPSPLAASSPASPPPVPSPNIAGDYTLTLTADPSCADLPPDARTTSYPLEIRLRSGPAEPTESWFEAFRQILPVSEQFASFLIRVVGDELSMGTSLSQHADPWLVRELAPLTYVAASGEMHATVSDASNITGPFHGQITRCVLPNDWGMRFSCEEFPVSITSCTSPQHQFTLARR